MLFLYTFCGSWESIYSSIVNVEAIRIAVFAVFGVFWHWKFHEKFNNNANAKILQLFIECCIYSFKNNKTFSWLLKVNVRSFLGPRWTGHVKIRLTHFHETKMEIFFFFWRNISLPTPYYIAHINKQWIKTSNCVRNQFWALTFNWTQLKNGQLAKEFAGWSENLIEFWFGSLRIDRTNEPAFQLFDFILGFWSEHVQTWMRFNKRNKTQWIQGNKKKKQCWRPTKFTHNSICASILGFPAKRCVYIFHVYWISVLSGSFLFFLLRPYNFYINTYMRTAYIE